MVYNSNEVNVRIGGHSNGGGKTGWAAADISNQEARRTQDPCTKNRNLWHPARPGYQALEPGIRQIGHVGSQASLSPSERAIIAIEFAAQCTTLMNCGK